jgi:hypothetical protein
MRRLLVAAGAAALLLAAPARADLPIINVHVTGPHGDNGWYVGPVTVKWTLLNEDSSNNCDTKTLTDDTPGVTITCTAWQGLVEVAASVPVKIDQTAPGGVTAAAARAPDSRSWFTAPVSITWSGTDVLSGIASCTSLSYAGPDATGAAPTGTCRDRAGNVSAPVPFSLDYDATPPDLGGVSATAGPGRADIHYTVSADTVDVTVVRDGAPPITIADGPPDTGVVADSGLAPGTTYTWTVTAIDQAGNAATQRATATTPVPAAAATSPAPNAVRLRWRRARGATYYNFQLFQGKRKVLSAWPTQPRFRIASKWRFRGRTQRLVAGKTYHWYAWAGFGPRSARHYGRMLAHGRFKVPG